MANGQYNIPEAFRQPAPEPYFEPQQTESFSGQPDIQQPTPETRPTPFHFIKEIEDRLDSYRYTAIEIEESKRPWLKSMKSLILAPKPIMAELIEKESKIGGRLLQKQESSHELRFWSEGHEWFFGWTDGKGVTITDSAVHYQVTDTYIQKSYQGHVVPFSPGEEEYFINAVQAYEHAVMHELYPFDEALVELMAKNDYSFDDLAKNDDINLAA